MVPVKTGNNFGKESSAASDVYKRQVFPKYTGKNYLFEYYIKDSIFFFHLDQVFA